MAAVESIIGDLLLTRVGTLSHPVSYPNVPFEQPAGVYLDASFMPNQNTNLGLAASAWTQHQGLLQITVVYPTAGVAAGVIAPLEIAGEVVEAFGKGTTLVGSGIKVTVPRKPSVAQPIQDGDRVRVPVTIPYLAFAR